MFVPKNQDVRGIGLPEGQTASITDNLLIQKRLHSFQNEPHPTRRLEPVKTIVQVEKMGSHDCAVRGFIKVKKGVSAEQVRTVLLPFIEHYGIEDFDEQVAAENIQFSDDILAFSLNFRGYGGYQNDNVDALVERLVPIVEAPDWIEILDFDTGDLDAACCPRFIATDAIGHQVAKLKYGIMNMADYIQPVIGEAEFVALTEHILALPRVTARDGAKDCQGRPKEA